MLGPTVQARPSSCLSMSPGPTRRETGNTFLADRCTHHIHTWPDTQPQALTPTWHNSLTALPSLAEAPIGRMAHMDRVDPSSN